MTARLSILVVLFFLLAVPSFAQSTKDSTRSGAIQERRQTLKERIVQKREEAASKAAAKREEFKLKTAQIRDTKKRATVERVQERLDSINQKRTDRMAEFLARLTRIVEKIESRIAKAKANGKDVTEAETAVVEAKAALSAAKAAVEAQAGKTYTIEIGSETGLREVVGAAMASLEKDLRATRSVVTDAKQVAQKIISLIKNVRGVDDVE